MIFGAHKTGSGPDFLIISCGFLLALIGFLMLSSASTHLGIENFNDGYFYIKEQFYNFLVGLAGFFIALKLPYRFYQGSIRSFAFLGLNFVLALLVFSPLGTSFGKVANRWIAVGPINFQPAEFFKITLIIYLASWLSRDARRRKNFKEGLVPFIAVLGLVGIVLAAQRSTSPIAILGAAALIMYFASGAPLRYIFGILALGLALGAALIFSTDYRQQRVKVFLDPTSDPEGSGYHVLQSKNAIGSGGLTGKGFGNSEVKFSLPEPIGDSIFAVFAEEFGFVGSLALVSIYAILILRLLIMSIRSPDMFSKMLLVGFASVIGVQTIFNIGAMSGFLPLTGTTLPFISYGGTSLIVFMVILGISANISRRAQ